MNMANTIKAERKTVDLGGIPLSVYRLPNGDYKLSGRNITDAVGEDANTLLRFTGVKSLKSLPNAGSDCYKITPATSKGVPFHPVSIADAVMYWGKAAERGNLKAIAILVASAAEAIERRTDAAYGITRTEADRNTRTKTLIDFILENPKTWTMHFKPNWQREACRVTGYVWHPSRPMAKFISTYIYKALPPDVYGKLISVNADRKQRHHQFFDEVADELVLKEHIQQVYGLLRVSRNLPHFKRLFRDAFSEGIQTDIIDDDLAC
jgi:hypothetical protein